MNWFNEMFARADIQHLRSFLLCGTEAVHVHTDSYKERIDKPLNKVNEWVRTLYDKEEDCEKMMAIVFDYASAVEEVHLEVGLQIGFMLCAQMYNNFKNALEG